MEVGRGPEMGVPSRPAPSRASLCLPRRQLERRQGGGCGCSSWAGLTAAEALGWADGSDGTGSGGRIHGRDRVGGGRPGASGGAGAVAQ